MPNIYILFVFVPQAAADGRGEQRAAVLCPLSTSEHRATRGGESTNFSSLALFFFPLPHVAKIFFHKFQPSSFCSFLFFQEKRKLQDEGESMSDRLNDEMESRRKMGDKLSHERHQSQKEKECTQEVQLVSLYTK